MDSVTQAALGATLGGAIAGNALGRSALLGGALLGTLPDLDVVIDYGTAVANFTQHRGFSHSLLVLTPLSLLLAWLLHRWRPVLSYRHWTVFCATILLTHPLLDAFTTYGTQLLWPFGTPVALTSVFIIDPLYTLPLLLGVAFALWRPWQVRPLVMALVVSTGYLGWSLVAQQLVTARVTPVLAELGAESAPRLVQPMPLSTLLWRVTVLNGDERLELVTGFLDGDAPPQVQHYPRASGLAARLMAFPEGERLAWFTRGFLDVQQQGDQLTATDIRLGLPGAHPFTFVLAQQQDGDWAATPSYRLPRPSVPPHLLDALWQRLLGRQGEPCLAALAPPTLDHHCS
ncbi:MAG: metal-dependent hydrolase [Marinobacter sp.]|uniref:metal-dependent hydrolase n=1 Tax=Marinobacter sp. TaxID=50741 RepID=UPI00299D9CDA|nr:metal-dependent hydrolase [Marinobacter sp.]MDX1756355.1 metal-dependent hydrolase [Marinobacter sp.]